MSKASNKRVGAVLKDTRELNGLSIRAVAEKTKIDHAVISRIENGKFRISFENAVVLCEYYGIPIQGLATYLNKRKNSNGKR